MTSVKEQEMKNEVIKKRSKQTIGLLNGVVNPANRVLIRIIDQKKEIQVESKRRLWRQ
jgi:hypothetical protein